MYGLAESPADGPDPLVGLVRQIHRLMCWYDRGVITGEEAIYILQTACENFNSTCPAGTTQG